MSVQEKSLILLLVIVVLLHELFKFFLYTGLVHFFTILHHLRVLLLLWKLLLWILGSHWWEELPLIDLQWKVLRVELLFSGLEILLWLDRFTFEVLGSEAALHCLVVDLSPALGKLVEVKIIERLMLCHWSMRHMLEGIGIRWHHLHIFLVKIFRRSLLDILNVYLGSGRHIDFIFKLSFVFSLSAVVQELVLNELVLHIKLRSWIFSAHGCLTLVCWD